ncbi:MAG: hypothetical protein Q4B69_06770 [Slackia sp.]|nr:hypothetical protein [Slackia sp.]
MKFRALSLRLRYRSRKPAMPNDSLRAWRSPLQCAARAMRRHLPHYTRPSLTQIAPIGFITALAEKSGSIAGNFRFPACLIADRAPVEVKAQVTCSSYFVRNAKRPQSGPSRAGKRKFPARLLACGSKRIRNGARNPPAHP